MLTRPPARDEPRRVRVGAQHVEAQHVEAQHVEAQHVEAQHVEAQHVEAQRDQPDGPRRPPLPEPRGPVSSAVLGSLAGARRPLPAVAGAVVRSAAADADPYGEDLQLTLYCLYELHYRGFAGVSDDREWDPVLLALRAEVERVFLDALRRDVPASDDVAAEIDGLLVEPVDAWGVSHHLHRRGRRREVREYVAHRSLYHLKEADPQAWVIARLEGPAKAALVTVEHDEYGAGDPQRMHAHLFAEMMRALELDASYGAYLDAAPAETLAEVNLMSLFGLHRRWRGALVGQFAAVELTSSPGSDRLVRALRRLGLPAAAVEFYAEHVEADAVHEQLVRRGVITPLLAAEPALAADIVFGIRASLFLADRLGALLLDRWSQGRSALRHPLPDAATSSSLSSSSTSSSSNGVGSPRGEVAR